MNEVPIDLESIAGTALAEHEIASPLRDTTVSSMQQCAPGNDLRLWIAVSMLLPEKFPEDVAEAIFSGMRRLNGKLEHAPTT